MTAREAMAERSGHNNRLFKDLVRSVQARAGVRKIGYHWSEAAHFARHPCILESEGLVLSSPWKPRFLTDHIVV